MSSPEVRFLHEALTSAAVVLREKYASRLSLEVSTKASPSDILTEADLAVQACLVEQIARAFPHDEIVAEEGEYARGPKDSSARCWVIDPIDGTQNFMRGMFPAFGISLAFAQGGVPQVGGVMFPLTGDLYWAARGHGAFRNEAPLHVSSIAAVDLARVEVDFSGVRYRAATLVAADTILRTAGQIRCHCASVVSLCSIAAGDMDGFVHVGICPWDYAAGQVIVEEAGGRVTRFDGSPVMLFDGRMDFVASNGSFHDGVLAMLVRER